MHRSSGSDDGGGPDRAWIEQVTRDIADVAPVVGLASPDLPGRLGSWETGSGDDRRLTLCYGWHDRAGGPYVEVQTALDDPALLQAMEPLAVVLAGERDRLFDHAGIDEPDPVDAREVAVVLPMDERRIELRGRGEGAVWAGRGRLAEDLGIAGRRGIAAVTVVARGVAVEHLSLTLVRDLRAWAAAAERHLREMPAPPGAADRSAVTVPAGLEGHERLLELVLADQPEGRRRYPRRPAYEYGMRWEAAVLGQMRLAGQSRADAEGWVTSMVNQLVRLVGRVSWWDEDGAAAIAETVRFTVFDSDVPSRPAQLAWLGVYDGDPFGRPLVAPPRDPPTALTDSRAEPAWLEAWDAWHANRHR